MISCTGTGAFTEVRVDGVPSGMADGSAKDVMVTSTSDGDGVIQDMVKATTTVADDAQNVG